MFIMMLVYIFFFGVLGRAFIAFGLRCYAHSLFSMGHIFFFENHGLGLEMPYSDLGLE
jgi:hypothetical protein